MDSPNRGAGLLYVHTLKVKVRNLLKFNVGLRKSFGKPSLRQKEGRATATIATMHGTQKHKGLAGWSRKAILAIGYGASNSIPL